MPPRFVMRTERDRVLAATARVVSARGYGDTKLWMIAASARTSEAYVADTVGDKEACVTAVYLLTFHQAMALTRDAADAASSWPEGVRDSLAAFLELLGAERDFCRCNLFGVRAMGRDGQRRLSATIEAFTAFLAPGFAEASEHHPMPVMLGEVIGSSIFHVVTKHIEQDRVDELPAALPQVVDAALAPFCERAEISALLAGV